MNNLDSKSILQESIFPGEQWFCYWRTSRSMWGAYISSLPKETSLVIPIFWGFHYDEKKGWDLERGVPEKDLRSLIELLIQSSRKFCFLVPLSPAPFLPNSGVPTIAARMQSIGVDGLTRTVLDSDGNFNKVFSFFDSKVFYAFSEFCIHFSKLLNSLPTRFKVHGVNFQFFENDSLQSYFTDRSLAFNQGFSRFLKSKFNGTIELSNPKEEEKLKEQYSQEVQKLFFSCLKENLADINEIISISLIAGGPRDSIQRNLEGGISQNEIIKQITKSYVSNHWFSTVLLSRVEKKGVLSNIISEHFGERKITSIFFSDETHLFDEASWSELELCSIYDSSYSQFQDQGLYHFLDEKFKWCYKQYSSRDFQENKLLHSEESVKVFHSKNLSLSDFTRIIRLFLMGKTVILDSSDLDENLQKRLELFYLENNLNVEKINFYTKLEYCSLGEGKLIIYEGMGITKENSFHFWSKIFEVLSIAAISISKEDSLTGFWRVRKTTSSELSFLDVRRLNLYNPTSYKKRLSVTLRDHFVFMKIIDPAQATAKSNSQVIEVELLPGGQLALDFGHFGESV